MGRGRGQQETDEKDREAGTENNQIAEAARRPQAMQQKGGNDKCECQNVEAFGATCEQPKSPYDQQDLHSPAELVCHAYILSNTSAAVYCQSYGRRELHVGARCRPRTGEPAFTHHLQVYGIRRVHSLSTHAIEFENKRSFSGSALISLQKSASSL